MREKSKKGLKITLIVLGAIALIIGAYFLVRFIMLKSIRDTGLPQINISTGGASITSNELYVDCLVSLACEGESFSFSDTEAGIRLRGNDTRLFYPKKPYRIKFDEKTSLFGHPENKSWVLLALYNDFSLIKDHLAFSLADRIMGEDFVPAHHYVDLYIDGKYQGIYLLTDQVNEKEGRLDVEYSFDENDTEVPFFVELDHRAPEEGIEGVDWFSIGTKYYAIKYPNAEERYTDEQFLYIKGYIETVDALTKRPDVKISELEEYIDIDSFINYYIVQETMAQLEINWKSVYMSKSIDGKLKMGPVWDFDWSVTGPSIGKNRNVGKDRLEEFRCVDHWFAYLYNNSPEIRVAFANRWAEVRDDILEVITEVEGQKQDLWRGAKKNHLRWYWYAPIGLFSSHFDEVISWCKERVKWLDTQFC